MPPLSAFRMPSARVSQGDFDVQLDHKASKGMASMLKGRPGRIIHDADVKGQGGFDKVFGNAAFEGGIAGDAPAHSPVAATEPGAVRMNNLFNERKPFNEHQAVASAAATTTASAATERESTQGIGRGPSIMGFFRKTVSPNSTLTSTSNELLGTLVQAFHAEDEAEHDHVPSTSGNATTPSAERVLAAWEVETKQLLASGMRTEALQRPAPSQGLIRCYIKRSKSLFGANSTYELYLEAGNVFLLAARRRKKSKASTFVISQDPEDLKRDTENCVAKLKANFVGTEYMLWTQSEDKEVQKGYAMQAACISYENMVGKKSGPRTMHVLLPVPESEWQPSAADGADSLSNSLILAKAKELPPFLEKQMMTLCSKDAEYNETAKGYTLDFGGRVKQASVKNLQLAAWDHNNDRQGSEVLLQFGKVDEVMFALDFAYPLSIETAFGVALASIDTKLCCAM